LRCSAAASASSNQLIPRCNASAAGWGICGRVSHDRDGSTVGLFTTVHTFQSRDIAPNWSSWATSAADLGVGGGGGAVSLSFPSCHSANSLGSVGLHSFFPVASSTYSFHPPTGGSVGGAPSDCCDATVMWYGRERELVASPIAPTVPNSTRPPVSNVAANGGGANGTSVAGPVRAVEHASTSNGARASVHPGFKYSASSAWCLATSGWMATPSSPLYGPALGPAPYESTPPLLLCSNVLLLLVVGVLRVPAAREGRVPAASAAASSSASTT
jgi:hypothetical protein